MRSHIWALRGDTGETIPGFPIALPHEETISGPILLLHDYSALTRYIEAQQLKQEESTLTSLLKRFEQIKVFPSADNSTAPQQASNLGRFFRNKNVSLIQKYLKTHFCRHRRREGHESAH